MLISSPAHHHGGAVARIGRITDSESEMRMAMARQ
jgi:hypothetical protein